jgi:hypothetical protein
VLLRIASEIINKSIVAVAKPVLAAQGHERHARSSTGKVTSVYSCQDRADKNTVLKFRCSTDLIPISQKTEIHYSLYFLQKHKSYGLTIRNLRAS